MKIFSVNLPFRIEWVLNNSSNSSTKVSVVSMVHKVKESFTENKQNMPVDEQLHGSRNAPWMAGWLADWFTKAKSSACYKTATTMNAMQRVFHGNAKMFTKKHHNGKENWARVLAWLCLSARGEYGVKNRNSESDRIGAADGVHKTKIYKGIGCCWRIANKYNDCKME